MKIIVPKGFYEEALSENVMAGTARGEGLLTCTGYYYPVMPGKYRDRVGNNQFPG